MVESLPRMLLKVDGSNASTEMMDSIISIEVDDSLTLPDMFSIHIRDSNYRWTDEDAFSLGASIEVFAKVEDTQTQILAGEITGLEPRLDSKSGPSLVLRGYDKSHRLNRGKKTATFLQMTDSDIAKKIAQNAGLKSKVDSTRQVHEYVLQDNKTDWEFLIARAQRVGFRVLVKEGTLHFVQTPAASDQTPTLKWGEDLKEFNARLSTAHQVSEVLVQGWDYEKQQQIVGRATQPGDMPQIGESKLAGQSAERAFGGSTSEIIVNRPVGTQAEADTLAQSICDEIGQGFITADCICFGNPAVQAGAVVKLEGLGKRFSGNYRVTHARHRYDASGYTTEFSLGGRHTATIGELLSMKSGTGESSMCPVLGVVTNNDDPNGQGRVKVKIPTLKDSEESQWARLVAPGAGNKRGLQWLPEVGDEVLVLFEHEEVHKPLIIGGLWSEKNPPSKASGDCIGSGAVNERIIQSRSGHVIILGDEDGKEMITICDKTGKNQIVIDSASNTMKVNADSDITIVSKGKLTVKSDGGDLELEGNNLTVKASQSVSLDAGSTCDIKSKQSCTVEGGTGLTMKNKTGAEIAMSGKSVNVNQGALEVT